MRKLNAHFCYAVILFFDCNLTYIHDMVLASLHFSFCNLSSQPMFLGREVPYIKSWYTVTAIRGQLFWFQTVSWQQARSNHFSPFDFAIPQTLVALIHPRMQRPFEGSSSAIGPQSQPQGHALTCCFQPTSVGPRVQTKKKTNLHVILIGAIFWS